MACCRCAKESAPGEPPSCLYSLFFCPLGLAVPPCLMTSRVGDVRCRGSPVQVRHILCDILIVQCYTSHKPSVDTSRGVGQVSAGKFVKKRGHSSCVEVCEERREMLSYVKGVRMLVASSRPIGWNRVPVFCIYVCMYVCMCARFYACMRGLVVALHMQTFFSNPYFFRITNAVCILRCITCPLWADNRAYSIGIRGVKTSFNN